MKKKRVEPKDTDKVGIPRVFLELGKTVLGSILRAYFTDWFDRH
ncbi:hypothetical protein [Hymenobacter rigui]|nr:hypothetical protein [Hymenobacter rigui]